MSQKTKMNYKNYRNTKKLLKELTMKSLFKQTISITVASLMLFLLTGCGVIILFKPSPYLDPFPEEMTTSQKDQKELESPLKTNWNLTSVGFEKAGQKDNDLKGNLNIKVAILSTGVDYNHKDLASSIDVNAKEITVEASGTKKVNYKDDDGDSLVDNIVGWDVVNGDGLAYDRHGAGTAVAGIIAAKSNREMKGLMEKVVLYPIKYINDNGQAYVSDLIQAIDIALKAKPDVIFIQNINVIQLHTFAKSILDAQISALEISLKSLSKSKIPVVIGAGEDMQNFGVNKAQSIFLNSLRDNLIVVSSIDKNKEVPFLVNTGFKSVTTFAPGKNIRTTGLKNTYQTVSGTAYAAAHVTAAIAIAKAKFSNKVNVNDLISALIHPNGGNQYSNLKKSSRGGTSLNIPKFINVLQQSVK